MAGVLRRKQVSLDLLGPNDFCETGTYDQVVVAAPLAMTGIDFRFTKIAFKE